MSKHDDQRAAQGSTTPTELPRVPWRRAITSATPQVMTQGVEACAFRALEGLRREARNFDPGPIPPLQHTVFDYAEAGNKVDAGKLALDEAVPNGQRERVLLAYNLLREGVEDLGRWLRAKGLPV